MKKWVRRIGYTLGGLLGVILLLASGIWGMSARTFNRTMTLPLEDVSVPTDSASVARGEHLVRAITKCVDCHGQNLGGTIFIDDPAMGLLPAPNLTTGKGGVLAAYTDAELEQAIRHGIRRDGTPLFIMPSSEYQHLADDDLGAILAYLRSLPPVDNEQPEKRIGPVTRTLLVTGAAPTLLPAAIIDHAARPPATMPVQPTREYGEYIANTGGCKGCHGPNLAGGKMPGGPPGAPIPANLTPAGIGSWSEADFTRALREGTRPDGSKINPFMPWLATRLMTDDEMRALWLYVSSVPAAEPAAP